MKRNSKIAALAGFTAFAICFPANAAKPADHSGVPFGRGFPGGAHFNLDILAKDANSICPDAQYDVYE